ncbi:MAG: hypothetical protein H0T62_11170 [Parachlamydiaceae bacterium]|nr:hypothetical protein [Parachlamydiaceae bacterium]
MIFGRNHENHYLSQICLEDYQNKCLSMDELKKFEISKILFLNKCNIDLNISKIKFIYETFEQRQLSLEICRDKNLNPINKRKVIALMGKNHGNPKGERIMPIVEAHFQKLNTSFVVIDPSLLHIGTEATKRRSLELQELTNTENTLTFQIRKYSCGWQIKEICKLIALIYLNFLLR